MWGNALVLAWVAMCLACGASPSGATTCPVTACGGNIVGSWKVVSATRVASPCGEGTSVQSDMGDCTAVLSEPLLDVSGSATFNADGTFTSDSSFAVSMTLVFGAACLSTNGVAETCAQLASMMTASAIVPPGSPTLSPVTCTATAAAGCLCAVSQTESSAMGSGTYEALAGTLTQTGANGTSDHRSYCVQGSTLNIFPQLSMSMGTTTLGWGYVYTKE
jgi:hypothetical protein